MCQHSFEYRFSPKFREVDRARLLTVVAYFGDGAFAGGMTGCEPDQVACEWMLARGCASPTPLVQHVETIKRPFNFRAFIRLR